MQCKLIMTYLFSYLLFVMYCVSSPLTSLPEKPPGKKGKTKEKPHDSHAK